MKTATILFNVTLLGLILGFSGVASAENGDKLAKSSPTNTLSAERTIATYFKFPRVLIPYKEERVQQPVKVEVIFTTDSCGKVTYAVAKTSNAQLKEEIERQFSNLRLMKMKENVAHSVTLNFRYLGGL
jgi:hypothetical protein